MNYNSRLKDIVKEVQKEVSDRMDINKEYDDKDFRELIEECVVAQTRNCYISFEERNIITECVFNSMKRNDILQPLLEDKEINEIMVNGTDNIYIEKKGKILRTNTRFDSEERLFEVIQNIVSKANKSINESNPIVDTMLPDGSRINIVLNPLALNGPCVTIRKFPKEHLTMEKLISLKMFDEKTAGFLIDLVKHRYNILISGGTSTGKTTLLNALSCYIDENERVITVEDSAELNFRSVKNIVRMETRDANYEGKGEINMRKLVKTSLRMRPDRLIIGEVRDEAALDMLQALNTGHDGSMSTVHANSAQDALMRLETMVLCAAVMPIEAIRHQIASAIEIIIHLERDKFFNRRVSEIMEICRVENGVIKLNTIYSANQDSGEGTKELSFRKQKMVI